MGASTNNISTVANPIKYFKSFFSSTESILGLKKRFFPDPSDIENIWNSELTSHIDKENESFILYYDEDVDWELDDSIPGYPTYNPTRVEQRTTKKFFKDTLQRYLYPEVINSKELIAENISESTNKDANRSNIEFWLNELNEILNVINNQPLFLKYLVCSDAITELISFINKNYCQYLSTDSRDENISQEKPNLFEESQILSPQFYSEIIKVEDENGKELFADMNDAKKNLLLLAGGSLEDIPSINFQWPMEASYYLLDKIRIYNKPRFQISKLSKSSNIKFKGKSTTEDAFSKGRRKYEQTNKKLKQQIDKLVERFIETES